MAALMAYLSHTQIAMYLRCARQYYFRYILGWKRPPSGALKQGGVFHKAAEWNYNQKINSRKDLPVDEMTDYFATTFESEWAREEVKLDSEGGETKGGLKDQGVDLIRVHRQIIMPTVQPVEVEHKLEYEFVPKNDDGQPVSDQSVKVMGVIDLVDEKGIIRDNKTAGRAMNQMDVDRDMQLSTYSLIRRMTTGKVEPELRLDVAIKTTRPQAVVYRTKRSREMLTMHRNTIGMVARGVLAEVFPRNVNGWHCSPKFCGYWDDCMGKGLVSVVDLGENLKQDLQESVDREEKGQKGRQEAGQKTGQGPAQAGEKGREKIQAAAGRKREPEPQ
jgi:CRISPR/Cas system-associated exonuclease Cas4 (RecB family)